MHHTPVANCVFVLPPLLHSSPPLRMCIHTCTSGATLDADWRDDTSFATCCNDGTIAVCKLGSDKAIKTFSGGKSEVSLP